MGSLAQATESPEAQTAEPAATRADIVLAEASRAEASPTEFASADAAFAADSASAAADAAPAAADAAGPDAPASSDSPADSSSSDDATSEVVITGSHIARSDYDSPQPVTAISAESLQAAAPSNIMDFAATIPALAGSTTVNSSSVRSPTAKRASLP